jgi:hypothetical protein
MTKAKGRQLPKDTTDKDEKWCLISCHTHVRNKTALTTQCVHKDARGQYVVAVRDVWHFFDPPTKLQALSWINGRPSRERRIHWLCFECGEIMPLGAYGKEKEKSA